MSMGWGWEASEGFTEVANSNSYQEQAGGWRTGCLLTVLVHWHGTDASQHAVGPQRPCCLLYPVDAKVVCRILASGTFRGMQRHLEAWNRMGLLAINPFNILIACLVKRMCMSSWPALSECRMWCRLWWAWAGGHSPVASVTCSTMHFAGHWKSVHDIPTLLHVSVLLVHWGVSYQSLLWAQNLSAFWCLCPVISPCRHLVYQHY